MKNSGRMAKSAKIEIDETLLDLHLRDALLTTMELSEGKFLEKRKAAHVALIGIYRQQLNRGKIDPRLRIFFDMLNSSIWASMNPEAELRNFMSPKRLRGRPRVSEHDNLMIALAVELRPEGESFEAALARVGGLIGRSADAVRTISTNARKNKEFWLSLAL